MVRNPYAVLGLSRDCTTKEICRSYRILALKYHPDKQRNGGTEGDKQRFIEIQEAYALLRDPAKRRKYDKTGSIESDPAYVNIDAEDIEAFAKTYPGSEEEKCDLKEFFERHDGDISTLYECIPLSEPSEESLNRYLGIYVSMFEAGDLQSTALFKKAEKRLRTNLPRSIKKFARERTKFAQQASSFDDLVSAIHANRKRRLEEGAQFFMAIEGTKKKQRRRVGT